jgi:hypothetical protein
MSMTYKQSRLRVSPASPEGWALIRATTWEKKIKNKKIGMLAKG